MIVCRAHPTRVGLAIAGAAAGAVLALGGCTSTGSDAGGHRLSVVTGFYATQYLAEQIGGSQVQVISLTPPGAEPHDLELTSRQVVQIAKSDLTITLPGFQPAVDDGIRAAMPRTVLDITTAAGLHPLTGHTHDGGGDVEHAETAEELEVDPHFWLDPERMAAVSRELVDTLSRLDPAGAEDFRRRGHALDTTLATLTQNYVDGLAHCANTDLVTGHAAYGHLAAFVGFTQHPLALNPDAEPSPATLAAITTFVREHHTRVIYTEPLASPKVAEVIAAETGARTAVLDPIEGLTDASAARDYPGLMRANLTTLISGQECTP